MKTLVTITIAVLFSQIGAAVALGQSAGHGGHHPAVAKKTATKTSSPAASKEKATAPSSATLSAFEKIKSLAGDWEARDGVNYGGKPIRISYRVVSQGTGVMETYTQVGVDIIEMVTVYHLDGDKLVMTHFCAVNNQVRLRAEPFTADPKELKFSYVDASNLSVSNRDVMTNLAFTFTDRDRFTQAWTWRVTNDKGKMVDDKAVYNFVRRK